MAATTVFKIANPFGTNAYPSKPPMISPGKLPFNAR